MTGYRLVPLWRVRLTKELFGEFLFEFMALGLGKLDQVRIN